LEQLANIAATGKEIDQGTTNFALAVVKGVEPRDQLETLLAVQMAAIHLATMTFAPQACPRRKHPTTGQRGKSVE
jgi:hypothetical protein